jgi:carboxypeptidase Q
VTEWNQRLLAVGGQAAVSRALDAAGAAGILTSRWSEGWGVNKVFSSATDGIPSIDLSCEDYGLLFRLAEGRGWSEAPRMRLDVEARFLGDEAPMANVIGTIPGTELPTSTCSSRRTSTPGTPPPAPPTTAPARSS